MDDREVIQYLMKLEKEANTLVDDAQAEADRKVSEGEKQLRVRYEEVYTREIESLEIHYNQKIAAVKKDYRQQLEAYRENLKAQPINIKAFSTLAENLLVKAKSYNT